MFWPNGTTSKPKVSSKYGDARGGGRKHAGTDFVGYTALHAIADGVVTKAGLHNNDAGHAVVIDSVIEGQTVTICRFHIAAGSATVKVGDKVKAGQRIATMGDTGNATGKCDHVEIRFWKGSSFTTVDPEVWLAARITAGLRPGSKVTKEQAEEISGWLARTYDTYQYWHDVQYWAIRIGAYPQNMHDGVFGPKTAEAELAVWQHYIAPKPDPEPTPEPEPAPNPDPGESADLLTVLKAIQELVIPTAAENGKAARDAIVKP